MRGRWSRCSDTLININKPPLVGSERRVSERSESGGCDRQRLPKLDRRDANVLQVPL